MDEVVYQEEVVSVLKKAVETNEVRRVVPCDWTNCSNHF
jgi:hypothetical protein